VEARPLFRCGSRIVAISAALASLTLLLYGAKGAEAKVAKAPKGLKFYKRRRSCLASTAP